MKRLLDYCSVSGKSVKSYEGIKKYVATADVNNDEIVNYVDVTYDDKPSRANLIADQNEILFAKMKDTKKVLLINDENCNNIYSTGFFDIKCNEDINPEYIYNFIKSESFNKQKDKLSTGATMKAINNQGLNDIFINEIPSIEIQNKIVKKLNNINRLIKIKNDEINKFNQLVKSQFIEMFGILNNEDKYNKVEFNTVVKDILRGPFGSDLKKSLYVPESIDTYKVYIQINAIDKNEKLGDYYISKEYFDQKMYKFELKPNDYIITCDGTIGKYVKLSSNMRKGIISSSLLKITLDDSKMNEKYFEILWENFMLPKLTSKIRNAALQHLPSAKNVGLVQCPLPPIELQNKFADIVKQIDKQKIMSEMRCCA